VPSSDQRASTPQWTPSNRELNDLELLCQGVLAPLDRFLGADDLAGVQTNGRLPDGTPWRAGITLTVAAATAVAASEAGLLELTDPEGVPLATVTVDDTWPVCDGRSFVGGKVTPLVTPAYGPFRRLFRSPDQLREEYAGRAMLAVPVTAALSAKDVASIAEATGADGAVPLLLALVGEGSPREMSAVGLIRATLAAAALIGPDARVVAVPLASRGDPAVDDWLRDHVAAAFGDQVLVVSGEGNLPQPVEAVVAAERPARERRGLVVFFTGLSGSGKSTLARALYDVVVESGARSVTLLDGDVVRRHLSAGLGFSPQDRETNITRIGFVAAEIARHGGMAICSPIAPYDATRQLVRRMVEDAGGGFVLVHVATPVEECERRDRKGLYARARAGTLPDFTGVSAPYETPQDADVRVDTTGRTVPDALADVLHVLRSQGWLLEGPDP
jgi:sulfate adenylyltransferase